MMDDGQSRSRGTIASVVAGIMFGVAWWLYIDGTSYGIRQAEDDTTKRAAGYSWLPPLGVTIALVMINGMEWKELRSDGYGVDQATANRAKLFLMGALLIAFASVAGSVYIMSSVFLDTPGAYGWAGSSVFVCCILIFMASWILRAGTAVSDEI